MRPRRRWSRLVLVPLGVLETVAGYATLGVLFEGYGPGTYLIHVGAFALLLAGLPTVLARIGVGPDRRGVLVAGLAFGGLYPLAVGLLWAGLVPPPYFPTVPSVLGLAVDRLGFVLLLAPVAVGYVLGAEASAAAATRGRGSRSLPRGRSSTVGVPDTRRPGNPLGGAPGPSGLAIIVALLSPLMGYIVLAIGPGGVYVGPPFFLYWAALFVGGVQAVPFYLIARWGYGDPSEPPAGTRRDGSN